MFMACEVVYYNTRRLVSSEALVVGREAQVKRAGGEPVSEWLGPCAQRNLGPYRDFSFPLPPSSFLL